MKAIVIYLVSGGTGSSGSRLIETALAQFPKAKATVVKHTHVRRIAQLEEVAVKAKGTGGVIIHTLVVSELRRAMVRLCGERGLVSIDLIGELMENLAVGLGRTPAGKPGLYRQLRQDYFDRVAAIEFAISHDDGQKIKSVGESDIVVLGLSRSGKTPLCMYLAVQGWKASNIPIVPGWSPPEELRDVDPRRVVGLLMEPEHLAEHRRKRLSRMNSAGLAPYAETGAVMEELESARIIYKRGRYSVLDVTNKPIESTAEEIVELMIRYFGNKRENAGGVD